MYERETYALFSHRADIKAKRNRITSRRISREKENALTLELVDITMIFVMFTCFYILLIL